MTQRRHIIVDPQDLVDVASLDGSEGCPAPLLGRCLLGCYYFFRPSKRPVVYEIDPTLFVEPVWTDIASTDVQVDDEVVIDTLVESRPLRLMSTIFSSTLAPSTSYISAVDFPGQLAGIIASPASVTSSQTEGSRGSENNVGRKIELQDVEESNRNKDIQQSVKKTPDVSVHRYEWFRSTLGWTTV